MGDLISGAFQIYSAIAGYDINQQQADATEEAARAQAELLRDQANQATAQAGNEQIKGEQEAAKRSRILAADIGSTYANWAGNGLSLSGSPDDTLGNILKTQVSEGVSDIDTIKDNAAMNVWSYQQNANSLRKRAALTEAVASQQADIMRESSGVGLVSGIGGGFGSMLGGGADVYKFGKGEKWWGQ